MLRFVYRIEQAEVELVYNYAAEIVSAWFEALRRGEHCDPQGINEYRRIIFSGVSQFACLGKPWPGFGLMNPKELQQRLDRNIYKVITDAVVVSVGLRFQAWISVTDFGPYEFEFEYLDLTSRIGKGRASADGQGWTYTDTESGVVFDPMLPFP